MNVKLNGNSLTLPKSLMQKLDLKPGSKLNIITNKNSIELTV